MPVCELLKRTPATELTEWAAFFDWEAEQRQKADDRANRRDKW